MAALALARLRMTTVAICATLPGAAVYAIGRDSVTGVVVIAVAEVLVAAVAIAARRDRIAPAQAPLAHMAVWLTVVAAVFAGVVLYHDPSLQFITALLVVSYGAVQLDRRLLYAAYGVMLVGWLGLALTDDLPLTHDQVLVLFAAFAIGHVVSRSSAIFIADAEALRAQTDAMRAVAEDRSQQLAAALAAAEREIVERKRAEDEREQMRDQFLASQKMEAIGTLAGGVAHDVNNVLAGILALAELSREDTHGRARDDLDQIIASCQRGAALTRNLLAFSRRGQHQHGPVRVDAVAQSVVALLERTIPKRIAVEAHLADDGTVDGDVDQLTQAVINLALNAVDAIADAGRISLFTRRADLADCAAAELRLPPGRYAAIAVHDTGTGLGLAMVYGTVAQHHGAIDVVSTLGVGTTVTLYLPAVAEVAVPEVAPEVAPAPAPRRRILVVDDETVVRTMTRRVLEKAGHDVVVAEDGAAALVAYRQGPGFAAVVMDMSMPGMSGAQCFAALRAIDPAARVLLVSGYADDHDLRTCLAHGAVGFLPKPYDRARLVAAIAAVVAGRAPGSDGDAAQP